MYSDFIDSPSKDCFSFNDQSSSYDMAEVNEISNQTNLDYIFDSYYSSVSQYNSNFELPEDCKNMSFSELFDQELFSTNENKDCQITIKIEEEEAPNQCYSVNDSQDIIGNCSSIKIEETIPSSSLSKSFAPKRGINRTSIKTSDNCDVKQLMCNPFFETDDLGIDKISVENPSVKPDPENFDDTIEQNIVGMEIKLCCSTDNSQNVINHKLVNIEDDHISSMSKTSNPQHRGITRTSIKSTDNSDVKNQIYNSFYAPNNHNNDQMLVVVNPSIPKLIPEHLNDIEQNTKMEIQPCYPACDLSCINNSDMIVKVENNIASSLSKSSIQKIQGIDKNSIKPTNHGEYDHVKLDTPIIKCEPETANYTVEQNIFEMETQHYAQNSIGSHGILKINNKIPSKLSKSTIPKSQKINRTLIKSVDNSDEKHFVSNSFYVSQDFYNNEMPVEIDQFVAKCKSKNVSNNIKHNIKMEIQSCCSVDDVQHVNNKDTIVKVKDNIKSSLSRSSVQKCQDIYKSTPKPIKNCDVKRLMYNKICQSKKLGLDKKPLEIDTYIIKQKPKDTNDTINQNINEKEIQPHYYSQKNTVHNNSILKIKDKIPSVLPNNSIPKHQVISSKSLKSTEYFNVKHLMSNSHCVSQDLGNNKKLVKINPSIAKCEPKYINNNIKQTNKTEIQSHGLKHINSNDVNVKVEDNIISSLSKSNSPKYENVNKTSFTTTKKSEVKQFEQKSIKLKTHIVKCEPEDIYETDVQNIAENEVQLYSSVDGLPNTMDNPSYLNINKSDPKYKEINTTLKMTNNCEVIRPKVEVINDIIQQDIVKLEVQSNDEQLNCENNIKYDGPNEMYDAYSCNTIIECVNSQNFIFKNELNMETEKKKISMEEYRAKRGKMNLLQNTSENVTDSTTELVETDNSKLKAIKEEFDRNTDEHFIGQKRKIDDEEQQISASKELINEEDQELQKKRMKIEYIKKLLPSSFASEIAKTSSLMKGVLVEDNENESNSDDSNMSNDKTIGKYTETHDFGYSKKEEKSQRKGYLNKVHPSHRSSRSDYCNKSGRSSSSSSNSDDYYNRNRINSPQQNGQYGQNIRNSAQRSKEQKRVVYVGQIPIKLGKRYLYSRFEEFGSIISITLHKKPDFRVYYAFVTYSDKAEAERAISHGNDDRSQVQLDIRFGERKLTQTPYYDLDDEWLTDWYGYNPPVPVVRTRNSPEKVSFQEELQEFHKLAQIKKLNQKSSQVS